MLSCISNRLDFSIKYHALQFDNVTRRNSGVIAIPASALSHTVVDQELEVVATAEAATESWEFYPAGHANQYLLKSHTDFNLKTAAEEWNRVERLKG